MKKLIVGNWKMNGTAEGAMKLSAVLSKLAEGLTNAQLAVCPPYIYIGLVRGLKNIQVGAQDCAGINNGAFTGDVSASMLADLGCTYVILGHSERRRYHRETDELVALKAARAHAHKLISIICVGETAEERETGRETEVVARQLEKSIPPSATTANIIIAYEPVWAIGTGKTATPDDVKAMHAFIRRKLAERFKGAENIPILYGGSMKPDNAAALLATPNVDGGLIGGASLDAAQFLAIAQAA